MPVHPKPDLCRPCALYDNYACRGFVPPSGRGTLGLTLMGEGGGEQEYYEGRPFVEWAPAGSMLEQIIRRVAQEQDEDSERQLGAFPGLDRSQFRILNAVNCRPKNNWLDGAPWETSAIAHCRTHRDREVMDNPPKAFLALGNIPTRTLTGMSGPKRGVGLLRGYVIPAADYRGPDGEGIPVIPTLHPSFLRRGAEHQMIAGMWDLRRALWVAKYGFEWRAPAEVLGIRPGSNTGRAATREEVQGFIEWVRQRNDPEWPIFYDIETPWSADEMEDQLEDLRGEMNNDLIESVQFWHHGRGLFIDLRGEAFTDRDHGQVGEWRELIQQVFDLPNPKAGWNCYLFDDPILKGAGFRFDPSHVKHDLMWAWHHSQPDLDANLQYASSFFNWPFPWKHLAGAQTEVYGLCDVAVLEQIWERLPGQMQRDGIWRGYWEHVVRFRRELEAAEVRGIPVDEAERLRLDESIGASRDRTFGEIQEMVPEELKGFHPKGGYKVLPKAVKTSNAWATSIADAFQYHPGMRDRLCELLTEEIGPPPLPGDKKDRRGEWAFAQFDADPDDPFSTETVWRLCIRKPFLPSSSDQVKAYIRFRKHTMPKKFKTGEETTEKKELERLGKKTGDPLYPKILEYREYDKMHSTYVVGWKPAADGRVHTQFTFRPATGQLSSINPSAQNGPKHSDLAKQWNKMIAAPPGYVLLEFDYSAFHVLTTGFEAGDELYMRLARIDPHSFLASYFSHVDFPPIPPEWSDDDIAAATGEVKARFKHARNKQAKPGILGYGFGLGVNNFFAQNREAFDGKMKGVREVFDLLDRLFPTAKRWRNAIRMKAHNEGRLISKHGYVRYFTQVAKWDKVRRGLVPDVHSEQAIAFLPANDAFGHIKDVSNRLGERGLNEKYGWINQIHDNLVFCCLKERSDNCMADVTEEMLKRSTVLVSKEVPEGLWCGVEAEIGPNRADLKTVLKTTHRGELVSA